MKFLEETIAEGATLPTYIIRKAGEIHRTLVGVDAYHLTPQAAWQEYKDEVERSIEGCEQAV